MPLTYQPFESVPELRELQSDLKMNVGNGERIVGGIAGVSLVAAGVFRRGVTRWALLTTGVGLLARSWSGRCPCYRYLELDQRHLTSGVPGNRGVRVFDSIEVNRTPKVLYQFWRDLEQLPRVMQNVESVRQLSNTRSRWKVRAPLGQSVEWDAEIVDDQAPHLIAWQSLPGAVVRNAGSVWFEPTSTGARVKVSVEFDPPAGRLGAAIAGVFGQSPKTQLAGDLARFKRFAERELMPSPVCAEE